MSSLAQLQRRMADAVMQPLSRNERMRRTVNGMSVEREAKEFIKPNDRLTSFERLEIYNRQYWFRVLDSFAEDFPGLRMVLGEAAFWQVARLYISEHPSRSFTLRNLGCQLVTWMARKSQSGIYPADVRDLALDMARLEWAHIEAFDAAERPVLGSDTGFDSATTFRLQPYLHLLPLRYPVDDLLLTVRQTKNGRLSGERRRKLLLSTARQRIYLAVHRAELSVHYKRLDREAFLLLQALQSGATLSEALEAAFSGGAVSEDAAAQLQSWFANWMELGWFAR
ncbi:MAG: DNA-binding domain-containing protein [Terriglobales bacterium]